jgi:hypothetical protein
MADIAVLVATAATIFGAPILVFVLAVRDFRQRARSFNSLIAGSRERLNQRDGGDRTAEHAQHRGLPNLSPRR